MLLNCHTYYSFGYGTLSPVQLLDALQQQGYQSFAITDINNTSAIMDVFRLAAERNMHAVAGVDFRNHLTSVYVALALNNNGFKLINDHLSCHLHQQINFDKRAPEWDDVAVIYPFKQYDGFTLRTHEYIGIHEHELTQLLFSPYKHLTHKFVILHSVTFLSKTDINTHRLLRAIHDNVLLSKLDTTHQANASSTLLPYQQLQQQFADFSAIVQQTHQLLQRCQVWFEFGKLANKTLKHYTSSFYEDMELLRSACASAIPYRYPQASLSILQRIEHELTVIEQMHFAAYFLINWDIVKYAKHKQYFHVGRGSGANSVVAYLLGITDVDPIALDLYFERFINIHRSNAPDFDIDFNWTDREDVTAYIFKRFGYHRTALLGSYSTFQHDAVIRELGKVFGLPPREIDKLQLPDTKPDAADHIGKTILNYGARIHGMPSHLSIHASGIIIAEEPIHAYTATFLPPKGFPTTHFSMLEAEDIGLFKFDILSQRGLGKIKDTVTLVKQNRGVDIDIHRVHDFMEDEQVKKLLRTGNTIGCFYVESPAMRGLLVKLKADDYLRLVAASSIIRPGVSKSGMMREYILRFRNPVLRQQARQRLPELYDILEETYGVMVYQEDVIKVAHLFAGLDLAMADYLRRGMSWKFKQRNEFFKVRERFFENCLAKGHHLQIVTDIWNQIESFGNFAFAKGHSASYAVESYQALYLKAHYPLEYMVATINNGGGFYRLEFYIHEARMQGAVIHPPCINQSNSETVLKGNHIYLGLHLIAEITIHTITAILETRQRVGEFKSLQHFNAQLNISIEQLRLLIRAGCFTFTGKSIKALLWEAHAINNHLHNSNAMATLFEKPALQFNLPQLDSVPTEEAFEQMELFGFPLSSPFQLLQHPVQHQFTAAQLPQLVNQIITIYGYLVTVKPTRTSKGERMMFGTFIDKNGSWIDTVHFPESAAKYPFTGNGVYQLTGKVMNEYDFISIDVTYMKRLPFIDRDKPSEKPSEVPTTN